MPPRNFLWNVANKYFAAGLIGLTISDRYASFMAVRGSSMSPTLNPHGGAAAGFVFDDYVLVEKLCLAKYKFARGDVVVFRSPINYKEKNVKRIAALPGDWIYLSSQDTLKVPEGHCWVLGDNEASSMDSRSLGPKSMMSHLKLIPIGLICGQATHVVWPPQRIGGVNSKIQHIA
ncbi:signal peptidase I family protein [Striga asiatica]|uniref:Mitochondrial inner membrane protease subunit 2 n=1 Tax=Striga asiatica TaxID=4170 RepID=A0A5A7P296_STRAF|nr:signal peptidase I family protein [Striga asiatica]